MPMTRDLSTAIDRQLAVVGIEDALLDRGLRLGALEAELDEEIAEQRPALVELRPVGELQLGGDGAREIARLDQLHLAGDRLLVEKDGGVAVRRIAGGARQAGLAALEEQRRLGLIDRRHARQDDVGADRDDREETGDVGQPHDAEQKAARACRSRRQWQVAENPSRDSIASFGVAGIIGPLW